MKRQVFVSIAMATCPRYILFDESFDGLDPLARLTFKKAVIELTENKDVTVLITSHSLRELEDLCDSYALIDNKNIITGGINDGESKFHKYQIAFDYSVDKIDFPVNILKFTSDGRVAKVVTTLGMEEFSEKIKIMNPLFIDEISMDFEEMFIIEVESRGYVKWKKYFLFHLKEKLKSIIITSLVIALVSFLVLGTEYKEINDSYYSAYDGYFLFIAQSIIAIILAFVMAIDEFSFKLNRRRLDEYYKWPISRKDLYLSRYFVGLIRTCSPVFINGLFLSIIAITSPIFANVGFYFLYLIMLLVLIASIYTIFCFAYTLGNTGFDGILLMVIYTFIFEITVGLFIDIFGIVCDFRAFLTNILLGPIYVGIDMSLFMSNGTGLIYEFGTPLYLIVTILLGGGAFCGLYFMNTKALVEDLKKPLMNPFGFVSLVPFVGIWLCLNSSYFGGIILTYLLFLAANKGVKFNKVFWIEFGSTALVALIVNYVCSANFIFYI